jgi:hypothetical protein
VRLGLQVDFFKKKNLGRDAVPSGWAVDEDGAGSHGEAGMLDGGG